MEQQYKERIEKKQELFETIKNMIYEYELPVQIDRSDAWYWVDEKSTKKLIKLFKDHRMRNNIIYAMKKINNYTLRTYWVNIHLSTGAIEVEGQIADCPKVGMFLTKNYNQFLSYLFGFISGLTEQQL